MRFEDWVCVFLLSVAIACLSVLAYRAFAEPAPEYIPASKAANLRCAAHGGVKSLTQPDFGNGTVVCADHIARTYSTRIK